MHCAYFVAGRCRSCTLIEQPYAAQLDAKAQHLRDLLDVSADGRPRADLRWLAPVVGPEAGFRNKAKMVVGGTVAEPTLGILDAGGQGVDLRHCGLYPPDLQACFPVLADFVTRAGLTPYDVGARAGELKHLLVTASPDGDLMVRLVLRSQEPVARLRKHLPWLLAALPRLTVVSVNLLPGHRAVLEGEREILLTATETLRMRVNGIDLHLRPQSFFQTNTEVAAALYRQARTWVEACAPDTVWDLFCGVGGFALHLAAPGRRVTGVESSREAVTGAELSAREAGLVDVSFEAGDATAFALASGGAPDLVVVNPPRRGLGPELAAWLERSGVRRVIYSSCSAESLARDLAAMPSLRPRQAQLLDMFPHTTHYEVLALLERG